MEFRIPKAEFLRGLRLAQSIADRKSTMPMIANVLLRVVGKDKLLVAATDLNVSVSAELSSRTTGDGALAVGAKALHDIVANLPDEDVIVRRSDNNWAEIRAGKVEYRLVGMPDRDFPKLPDHREVEFGEIDAAAFRDMIDKTLFSVSNDETRFHLHGVYFECTDERALMVSTDGHRLSKIVRTLAGAPTLSAGVIIPKKGLVEIKRTLDGAGPTCELSVKPPYVFVRAGDITLAVKLIDADFPPYEAVIPKDNPRKLIVDRQRLAAALKRAQLMSSDTRGVKLALRDGTVQVSGDNPDIGEVHEEFEADYAGDEVNIGFNPKYVIELLAQIPSDRVSIELNGELDPALIRPVDGDDYLGVVMPMRI
ncbi:MAG: DNA polymerase III subunit beta [Deltaproteobacteria bacterium]|nr:MAG: DNA polymerase III subunit beta [Deltaproteobacteria bacterium]